MSEERPQLGPAMAELDDRQRDFVRRYVAAGGENPTRVAQQAGYSPTNPRAAAVTQNRLLKNPKILAAIKEVSTGMLSADLPKFMAALRSIALDPQHRDAAKVLIWIHQTLGISPLTRHEITQQIEITTKFDRAAAIEDLRRWERELGVSLLPKPPEEDDEP